MKISKDQVGSIIRRIEVLIAENGMSKKEFYEKSGISSALFSQWNTNLYVPTEKSLTKAAKALGCTVDFLVNGEQKEKPSDDGGGLDETTKELFRIIRNGTSEDREMMLEMLRVIEKRRQS